MSECSYCGRPAAYVYFPLCGPEGNIEVEIPLCQQHRDSLTEEGERVYVAEGGTS